MKIQSALLLAGVFGLTGCVSALNDPQNHVIARNSALPKINTANLSHNQKLTAYENQFVTDNTKFATIRGYPFAPFNDALLNVDPIQVIKVDDMPVKVIPANLNHGSYYFPAKMSETQLKIPAGPHQLLVTGTGFENKARYTLLPKMNFEAGKSYIIKPLKGNKGFGSLQVFEYQFDARFKPSDKDGIILGNAVTDPIAIDNTQPNF